MCTKLSRNWQIQMVTLRRCGKEISAWDFLLTFLLAKKTKGLLENKDLKSVVESYIMSRQLRYLYLILWQQSYLTGSDTVSYETKLEENED